MAFEHRYFRLNSQEWSPYGVPHVLVRKPAAGRSVERDRFRGEIVGRRRRTDMAGSMLDISVVIPTYNRLRDARRGDCRRCWHRISTARATSCSSATRTQPTERRNTSPALRAEHPNVRHLPGVLQRARSRSQRRHRARPRARSCCSTTRTFSRRPICSRLTWRGIANAPASPSSDGKCRSKISTEYAYKREHPQERGHLHPPSRKKLSWLYFLTGNASVRARRSACRRLLRRKLHRLRSRGPRARVSPTARRHRDRATSRGR